MLPCDSIILQFLVLNKIVAIYMHYGLMGKVTCQVLFISKIINSNYIDMIMLSCIANMFY